VADLKRNAWQLAREAEKKDAGFQIAHSELSSALARAGLKRLAAEDAKKQAGAATKALQQLKEKIARAKAKEIDNAKPETGQPAGTVDGEGARQVAEGQTVSSGQAGQ